MDENVNTKWYDRLWVVVLLCIFLFPIGLYAIWKSSRIAIGWKVGYSALVALILFVPRPTTEASKAATGVAEGAAVAANSAPELSKSQKDSLAKAEKLTALEARKSNTVSAEDLVQHYVDNEVRADGNFKGKRFYVEGTVADIGKDILGSIYVTLKGPEYDFREVQCYFNNADLAAQLNKGNIVAFYGRCEGLMMNVLMKECELVEGTWALEEEAMAQP